LKDYYKISLEILLQLLKGEGYENWEKWISEDIRLWEAEKSTEHHLQAYGGMGSFNDIVIGGQDIKGLWKSRLFGMVQTLSWSFAKGNIQTISMDDNFYGNNSKEISGWRCRNCGAAKIKKIDIERYISSYFLPKFFVASIKEDNLMQIGDLDKIINSKEVIEKRQATEKLVEISNIELSESKDWNWTCPKCQSQETCAYRWILTNDDTELIEADDNLEML
jgi:hypothetical protein